MQQFNTRLFKKAVIITTLLGIITLTISFIMGKIPFFLLLNTDLGPIADKYFVIATWLGDGIMYIPLLLIALYLRRKDSLPLLISSVALTTIFTQICKYFIVPGAPRPSWAITDPTLYHAVPGVELHIISSFPSGHTGTAFTVYLVFCLLFTGNWWLVAGLFYALSVAYSRIYLAQHFPMDAGAGMIVAAVSVTLSWWIQQWFNKRKANNRLA